MSKIEQVREAIEACIDRLPDIPSYQKCKAAIAILKDMDGQEPVAWMNGLGNTKAAKFHDPSNPLGYDIPLYAHPSPSAPVDIAEIIEKGDQAIRMWHDELKADGWDSSTSLDLASGDWTTATAKHRTK